MADPSPSARGLTTSEVAQRYRVSEDKVRAWIKAGQLRAVNTSDAGCTKPRFVVLPEVLAEFENRRAAAAQPKPVRSRRLRIVHDYYPG